MLLSRKSITTTQTAAIQPLVGAVASRVWASGHMMHSDPERLRGIRPKAAAQSIAYIQKQLTLIWANTAAPILLRSHRAWRSAKWTLNTALILVCYGHMSPKEPVHRMHRLSTFNWHGWAAKTWSHIQWSWSQVAHTHRYQPSKYVWFMHYYNNL